MTLMWPWILLLLSVASSEWIDAPQNCWSEETCLIPYNIEKYPLEIRYDFTTSTGWLYVRFWSGREFVGTLTWQYKNNRLTIKAYTQKCHWENLVSYPLQVTKGSKQDLIFNKESDHWSITLNEDTEIYSYYFDKMDCGVHWKRLIYRVSYYGLKTINAKWYKYSILGDDDELAALEEPFKPVPDDCYEEYECTIPHEWGMRTIQIQYDVSRSEEKLEMDLWRGKTEIGGITWAFNATDEYIYVGLFGGVCDVYEVGRFHVGIVGKEILTFHKTEEYFEVHVGENILFQYIFKGSACHANWKNSFDRINFAFLESLGALYR